MSIDNVYLIGIASFFILQLVIFVIRDRWMYSGNDLLEIIVCVWLLWFLPLSILWPFSFIPWTRFELQQFREARAFRKFVRGRTAVVRCDDPVVMYFE